MDTGYGEQRAVNETENYDKIIEAAETAGHEAGVAAGSWVIDGNTTENTARAILTGIEDGDPEVLDGLPSSPLSGEWADGLTIAAVLEPLGLTAEDDAAEDALRAFEDGYSTGVVHEVERSARAIL